MKLRASAIATLCLAAGYAGRAEATFPHADCEEFAGTGNAPGWTYAEAVATLQNYQNNAWVDAVRSTAGPRRAYPASARATRETYPRQSIDTSAS